MIMKRHQLKKTLSDPNEQRDNLDKPNDEYKSKAIELQHQKIEALLRGEKNKDRLKLFEDIMKCPLDEYDQKLVDFIPALSEDYQTQSHSIFENHVSKTLSEATLISNYQLFSYKCNSILSMLVPILVEQYKLNLMQKSGDKLDEHKIQLEVVDFGRVLSDILVLPFQKFGQDFFNQSEEILMQYLIRSKLSDELWTQDLSLARMDYVNEKIEEAVLINYTRANPICNQKLAIRGDVSKLINENDLLPKNEVAAQEDPELKQIDRIIEKLKQRKAQLLQNLNE